MCEKIDCGTFIYKLLSTKVVGNQKPMDGEILKEMIATDDKSIKWYTQIFKSRQLLSAEK